MVRAGRLLGVKTPEGSEAFTPSIAEVAVGLSGGCDAEVAKRARKIYDEFEREELRFAKTLGRGEEILADMIKAAKTKDPKAPKLSGDDAFTLYDTYGFPLDITTDVATEEGVAVDVEGFEVALEVARNLSRDARVTVDVTAGDLLATIADELATPTKFTGYGSLVEQSVTVRAIVNDGVRVESAAPGETVEVVLDATPFYAEGGGQVGDEGEIQLANGSVLSVDGLPQSRGGTALCALVRCHRRRDSYRRRRRDRGGQRGIPPPRQGEPHRHALTPVRAQAGHRRGCLPGGFPRQHRALTLRLQRPRGSHRGAAR